MALLRRAVPLLLVAALALAAKAGVVAPAYAPVYAPPAAAWSAPLGAAFGDASVAALLPSGIGAPSLTSPEGLRATAPLVRSMQKALGVSPQVFAAMRPEERKAAIELAVEDARDHARGQVYQLVEEARAAAAAPMDKAGRANLYQATAKLMEVRRFYGPWLDEDAAKALETSWSATSAKAWEVRTSLLESGMPGEAPEAKAQAAAHARAPYVLRPTGNAEKLRADMENNKSGWGQSDLDALYTGYGFVLRQGNKHRFYSHPYFPQLHDSVSRQNDLPPGYAASALKNIAELERLTAAQHAAASAAPVLGPPATLSLEDLSVLLSRPKEKKGRPAAVERERPVRPAKAPVVARQEQTALPFDEPKPAPAKTAPVLQPATERPAELKPEPPPAETSPERPSGLSRFLDRVKAAWPGNGRKS